MFEFVVRHPYQLGVIHLPRWGEYASFVEVVGYLNRVQSHLTQSVNQLEPLQPTIRYDVKGQ